MRIAFVDGEMNNLDADGWGQMLCWSRAEYQPKKDKPWANIKTFELRDYKNRRWDDRGLAVDVRDDLEQFDIVVSWNGIMFDIPFLNTRLRSYGCKEVRLNHHKDLMYTARYKLKLSSASLANVQDYLRIQQKYGTAKTIMDKNHWRKAMCGVRRSYDYIIRHNVEDVKVLAAVWQEIKHLVGEIK